MSSVSNIRNQFVSKLSKKEFTGNTIEILGASFIADDVIFGTVNEDYVKREIEWYNSRSLYVQDIPGTTPKIWEQVSDTDGKINSNYGYLLFRNNEQYLHVINELKANKESRKAVAIYTRPEIHEEWNLNGMSDFICTNAVHYEIRDNKLHLVVQMRSNDAIFGYKNDYLWQKYTQIKVLNELIDTYPLLTLGDIHWQVASLHIYSRHYYLVDNYRYTNEISINKEDYTGKYK